MAAAFAIGGAISACTILPGFAGGRAGVPRCARVQLRVRVFHSFAGLGTAGAYIAFINRANRTCWLAGWPRVDGISFGGRRIHTHDSPAREFPDVSATGEPHVVLYRGQRADVVFDGADGPGPGHPCRRPLEWLEVTAPGTAGHVRVSAWIAYLNAYMPTCSSIRVSPVMPARDLYRG